MFTSVDRSIEEDIQAYAISSHQLMVSLVEDNQASVHISRWQIRRKKVRCSHEMMVQTTKKEDIWLAIAKKMTSYMHIAFKVKRDVKKER